MKSGIERIGRDITVKQARRGCFEKVRYASKNAARDRAAKMHHRHPEWNLARPYKCALCSGFHLTTHDAAGKVITPAGRNAGAT